MTAAGSPTDDATTFAAHVEALQRELHVHCYRMLASFDEADDAVQETLLRAWRARSTFDGSTGFRAWLYRIATNVCLDMLRRRSRQRTTVGSPREVPWLFVGIDQIRPLLERAFGPEREGDWRLLPGALNRMPAAASYLRRPGTRRSGPSSATCCASRAARSPRSPRSAPTRSRPWACR